MNHGGGDESGHPSRRHRHDTEAPEGLSVADLLARHGIESGDGGSSRRHRLRDTEPDPEQPAPPVDAPEPDRYAEPEPVRRQVSPSRPSMNLFAQLGKAEPDDSPTDVVPKVPAEPTASEGEAEAVTSAGPEATEPPAPAEPTTREAAPPEPAPAAPTPLERTPDAPAAVKEGDHDREPEDDDERGFELRTRRIDESLTRLTAIHAGLGQEMTERVSRTRGLPVVDRTGGPPNRLDDEPGDAAPSRVPAWLRRTGKGVVLAAALALFVTTAAGWGTRAWLDGKLRTVAALDPAPEAVVDPAAQAGDQNYLLVGLDPSNTATASRGLPGVLPTAVPTPAVPTTAAHAAGPGTVMLAHVPASGDGVVLMAFPGDLAVDRPSCDRWSQASATYPGGTSPAQRGVQLASTYTVGGPRCVTKTIQQLTGLAVNHYTDVDLAAVKGMVDAMHGVPVCLPSGAVDDGTGGAAPAGSGSVLAGDQALAFVRGQPVQGDLTPGVRPLRRQQLFLTALLRKAGSDQVLTDFGQLSGFVTAFGEYARGDNAGLDQLGALVQSMLSVDPAKISLVTVPTFDQPDTEGNELLRVDAARALFEAIREKRPLPSGDDDGGADDRAGALSPRAVTVQVLNGSTHRGVANVAADSLRTLGFTVASVGNAPPSPGGRTVIRHSPDRADQAAVLAAAVPSAVTEPAPGTAGQLQLVLGDGFDGQVRAAPAAGAGSPTDATQVLTVAATSCG